LQTRKQNTGKKNLDDHPCTYVVAGFSACDSCGNGKVEIIGVGQKHSWKKQKDGSQKCSTPRCGATK